MSTSWYFFFRDVATTEIYTYCHTLSLHDALPISSWSCSVRKRCRRRSPASARSPPTPPAPTASRSTSRPASTPSPASSPPSPTGPEPTPTRGHRFRTREPEAIGSTCGTNRLEYFEVEPIASGKLGDELTLAGDVVEFDGPITHRERVKERR